VSQRLAIPRRVRLRGRSWRVRTSRTLWRDERAVGLCRKEEREILISASLTRREREVTLCHEILHALWPEGVCSAEDEERIIARLEEPFRALLLSGQVRAVPEEAR
jgi:hypothetical protein